MPRIPDIDAFGARPIPSAGRPVARIAPDASGAAIADVGRAISGLGEAQAGRDADMELATARSMWLRETLAAERETVESGDPKAWAPTYGARLTEARERIAGGLKDNRAKERFALAADDDMARGEDRILGLGRRREIDQGRAALDDLVSGNIDAAVGANDPQVRDGLLGATQAAIRSAEQRGLLSAEEAGTLRRRAASTFAERRVAMLPPAERLAALGGGRDRLPDVASAAIAAAGGTPDEAAWLRRVALLESAGDPGAVNPSGASGLFQFMPPTAAEFGLSDPFDAGASATAALALRRRNEAQMAALIGRKPSASELYLAHQQGAGGAAALLRSPGANVVDALAVAYDGRRDRATAAVIQNGGKTTMTAGAFAALWDRKYQAASRVDAVDAGPDRRLASLMPADKIAMETDRAQKELDAADRESVRAWRSGFADFASAVEAGADIDPAVSATYSDAAINAMGQDAAEREMLKGVRNDTLLAADASRRVKGASPDQLASIAQEMGALADGAVTTVAGLALAPDRRQRAQALSVAIQKDWKARMDDPAAYAGALIETDGPPSEVAARLMSEQARLGVPAHARRVLTKDRAEGMARELSELKSDEIGPAYANIDAEWGPEAGRMVRAELDKAGVPPEVSIAGMYADRPVATQAIASVIGQKSSDLKEGLDTGVATDVRTALAGKMDEFRRAFLAGDGSGDASRQFSALFDVAERIALMDARRHGEPSEAVARAFNMLIGDVYETVDTSSARAYVPKVLNGRPVDIDAVGETAERMQSRVALEAFNPVPFGGSAPEPIARARTVQAALNGYWITNENADGLVLVADMGDGSVLPIIGADGAPYGFSFLDARMALFEAGAAP